MATDFKTNVTSTTGSFAPSIANVPLDVRERVETEADIMDIPKPWLGMIVYVKDTGKRYEITGLKDIKVGFSTVKDGAVDTYKLIDSITSEQLSAIQTDVSNLEDADIFKSDKATSSSLGGIAVGDNLAGLSIQEILTKLLYPYVQPAVTASLVCTPEDKLLEKGRTVIISKIKATVVKTSEVITKVAFLVNNVEVHTITEAVSEGGDFEYALAESMQVQADLPVGYFKVAVTDAKNETTTVDIATANFIYPFYFGVVNENTEVSSNIINGLSKVVDIKKDKEFTYITNGQHMVIAYPKNYGELASIVDANGFNIKNSFERHEVTVSCFDGTTQSYLLYINGASTVSSYKIIFKF